MGLCSGPIMAPAGNQARRGARPVAGTFRAERRVGLVTATGWALYDYARAEWIELKNRCLEVPGIPPNTSCEAWYLSHQEKGGWRIGTNDAARA